MSKSIRFQLTNARAGGQHSVVGADLAIGYDGAGGKFIGLLEVRGLWLKRKKDGSGYFVSFPASARLDKQTKEPVMKDGFKVYDNHVDLYMELGANKKNPDSRGVTEAAFDFRNWLIQEMVTLSETMDAPQRGRGTEKPTVGKAAPTRAAMPSRPPAAKAAPVAVVEEQDEEESEDGFPFN